MPWSNKPVANNGSTNNNGQTASNSYNYSYGDAYTIVDQNKTLPNLFSHTKDFKDVTSYNLMRGVPDFGSLVQFNPYETGYAAFIVCKIPKFIEMLAAKNDKYRQLVDNFVHRTA